jgi:hypothetical protein
MKPTQQEVIEMDSIRRIKRAPAMFAVAALAVVSVMGTAYGALQGNDNGKRAQVLIGADNDTTGNGVIQPVPAPPDQSLSKGDQLTGGSGSDMIIGRLGTDVILAGAGDDVMVGGTEGGQPAPPLPNSDIAFGGTGSDTFVWSPGDGSDAFVGGNRAKGGGKGGSEKDGKGKKSIASAAKKKGKKGKRSTAEVDTLVIGNQVLTSDNSLPQLFQTKFGQLPRVFSSDRGVPTPLGGTPPRNPNLTGLCEIVPAPAGLGYEFLVRFFATPGNLAVTIRTKGVEQVICPTAGSDAATQTSLGSRGAGPLTIETTDFKAAPKSKLSAFVF